MNQVLQEKTIEGFPNYTIREDGVVWNKRLNRPVPIQYSGRYRNVPSVAVYQNKEMRLFTIKRLLIDYFWSKDLPQIEGVQHKPMFDYENIYQIYSNGQIWSKKSWKWMTSCLESRGRYYLYCLQNEEGKTRTEYVHRLLAENFILNGHLDGFVVHHKNHNTKDNRIENLEVLTPLEHKHLHQEQKRIEKEKKFKVIKERPKHYKHSAKFLAKKAAKENVQ